MEKLAVKREQVKLIFLLMEMEEKTELLLVRNLLREEEFNCREWDIKRR